MSQSNNSTNKTILCIPGVFSNIKEERIRRIFAELDIGNITRIDIILPKINPPQSNLAGHDQKEKKQFNRVFVHIEWNQTPQAATCLRKLTEGKEVKIVYDEPWFWKVSAYRPPAPKEKPKPKVYQQKKARLEIEDDEEKFDPNANYSGIIATCLTDSNYVTIFEEKPSVAADIQYDEDGNKIIVENLNYSTLELPAEFPKKKKTKLLVISDKNCSK